MAQLLKGGGPVFALVPGVLKAWRVHHHDGGHGEVVGGEGSGGERRGALRGQGLLKPRWSKPPTPLHHRDGETRAACWAGLQIQQISPLAGCVTVGNLLNLSEHGFPPLLNAGRDE